MKENLEKIKNLLIEITEDINIIPADRLRVLFTIMDDIIEVLVKDDGIRFTTLFAKISYTVSKFHLAPRDSFLLQTFRRGIEQANFSNETLPLYIELGAYINQLLLSKSYLATTPTTLSRDCQSYFIQRKEKVIGFKSKIEGLILQLDDTNKTAIFVDEERPGEEYIVKYDAIDKNELFTQNITTAAKILPYPIPVSLIDVELLDHMEILPAAIIVNPDYLIDVTAISNAAKDSHGEYWLSLIPKFLIKENNLNILIGNLTGMMLDRIITDDQISFDAIITQIFNEDPLQWTLYNDDEVKSTIEKLHKHYTNIRATILHDFATKSIIKSNIYLEPSFFCKEFGIQGRLDLLHLNGQRIDIIELKSGKPFNPNKYGINHSHYIQALLYDIIIKSVFNNKAKPVNYILYSAVDENRLRYAPATKIQQYELMKIRNDLMLIDYALALSPTMAGKMIGFLKQRNFPNTKGFSAGDLLQFENIYTTLDGLEKSYFNHFASFIAKELIIAKVGEYGREKSNGLAGLWLDGNEEKKDRFAIMNHLHITHNHADDKVPTITFQYSEFTSELSNFRIGDIVVLYPHSFNQRDVLHHQIFKATLIAMDNQHVTVKLRHAQKNLDVFTQYDYWNIEQDVLDSTFRHMYKNLFFWATADMTKRQLILGRQRPAITKSHPLVNLPENLTGEQKHIISQLFYCQNYMLLWGPPGTGKTSEVVKHLTMQLIDNTTEKIMLLAYTNRAVDEICEALLSMGLEDIMVRIGSTFAVGEHSKDLLLQHKIASSTNRKMVRNVLERARIYVGTLSSILGKQELFSLVSFDTVIIDEASQILEPMLCGLLTQFKRFILIGDHKQLPSVVAQSAEETIIKDKHLQEIGITDTRTSLFERLYLQCKQHDWFHATAMLSYQGRMHIDIMQFVNQQFYDNQLKAIPHIPRLHDPLHHHSASIKDSTLAKHRMIYINTPLDQHYNYKTNIYEARLVADLVNQLLSTGLSIGIITPYRAQIALIKSQLTEVNAITVDTVERFQGGARDIIIISLCINKMSQLNTIVSTSSEGIDRKLNVALTRAKEQIIVLGNKDILQMNPTYAALIATCTPINF